MIQAQKHLEEQKKEFSNELKLAKKEKRREMEKGRIGTGDPKSDNVSQKELSKYLLGKEEWLKMKRI